MASCLSLVLTSVGCVNRGFPVRDPWSDPSLVFMHGDLGLGAPEGNVALGAGVRPSPWSTLELGTGITSSGLQGSLMAGLRGSTSETGTVGISSGLSLGREIDEDPNDFSWSEDEPVYFTKTWDWVARFSVEGQGREGDC